MNARLLTLFFLMSMGAVFPATARITVQIQPNQVAVGESAQLIFTSDTPFTDRPDLGALQTDFEIAGAQTRSSVTIINGQKTTQHELLFNILPLKTGSLTVPPLKIGRETTPAVQLIVQEKTTPAQPTSALSFKATLSADTIYEGESLLYKATLTESTGVFSAEIKPPHLENATIEQFADDTVHRIYHNQKPANVLTRTYLITPHATGKQTIQPARFWGQIPREQDASELISPFGTPMEVIFAGLPSLAQDVLLPAKPLTLTVLPKPADYGTDWWLPARELNLNILTPLPESGTVGDPITLVFELLAVGTDANELPALTLPSSPHFKIYTNPAQRQNFIDAQDRFTGRLAQEVNLIPLHAGTIELPLPTLPWFNTTRRQKQTIALPPVRLTIEPSLLTPAGLSDNTPTSSPSTSTDVKTPASGATPSATADIPTADTSLLPPDFTRQSLKWGSTLAFFLLALTGIGFIISFVRKKRKNKKSLPDLYPY